MRAAVFAFIVILPSIATGCRRPGPDAGIQPAVKVEKPQQVSDEQRLSAEVERIGGKVDRDEKQAEKPIVQVNLTSTKINDADLADLAGLETLQSLVLGSTPITDAGFS